MLCGNHIYRFIRRCVVGVAKIITKMITDLMTIERKRLERNRSNCRARKNCTFVMLSLYVLAFIYYAQHYNSANKVRANLATNLLVQNPMNFTIEGDAADHIMPDVPYNETVKVSSILDKRYRTEG